MSKYTSFIFKDYVFSKEDKTLSLNYSYDGQLDFKEVYRFDFDFIEYSEEQLDRALTMLHLMAGVSYFKAYLPEKIELRSAKLTSEQAEFYSKTYQYGLGEFFYVNKLDPGTQISFPAAVEKLEPIEFNGQGLLVGIGGGKDSLVVVEALRAQELEFMTWSLNHRPQFEPLVETIGAQHAYVERTIDPKLLELNHQDALNGHIPISAIIACVGVIVAILTGKRDVVVGNEQTADEPDRMYKAIAINHQYSKSRTFERDMSSELIRSFGGSVRYYSFLRPMTELFIAEVFARLGFEKYKGVFSSCNRAYTLHSHEMFWCGECPKCAFIFLILTPFIERSALEALWHGKNLLLDPSLKPTYRQLVGIEGDKPLDCVGEVKEARSAMKLDQAIYPELSEYVFELPEDYDYRIVGGSDMPSDIRQVFDNFISKYLPRGQP